MSAAGGRQGGIRGVVVKTAQGYFCVDPQEQFVAKSLLDAGAYGLEEIEQARALCGDGARVLVVGAHVGAIAIPLARFCEQLVAIEANPDTCELLELNVAMNRSFNVEVHNVAANDEDAEIEFLLNTVNSGGSKRMPRYRDDIYFYDRPRAVPVRGVRLDGWLADCRFDLVFMDIEGSEYFAFLGMQEILSRTRALIVEFLPHHLSRVAGVTVEQFLEPVAGHFSSLTVPSRGLTLRRRDFLPELQRMFDAGHGDAGIIFRK